MIATVVSMRTPSPFADIALLTGIAVSLNALVRLALCLLATYAAVKALGEPGTGKGEEAVRQHYLAVLRAILATLTRWRGFGERRNLQPLQTPHRPHMTGASL